MFNKFKCGEKVIVNGKGKCMGESYINKAGKVVERDMYYRDYCVKFSNGKEDWFNEKSLRRVGGKKQWCIKKF